MVDVVLGGTVKVSEIHLVPILHVMNQECVDAIEELARDEEMDAATLKAMLKGVLERQGAVVEILIGLLASTDIVVPGGLDVSRIVRP